MSYAVWGLSYFLGMCVTGFTLGACKQDLNDEDVPFFLVAVLAWPAVLPCLLAAACADFGQRVRGRR